MRIDDFAICLENLLLFYYLDMFLVRRWKHPAVCPAAIALIWTAQFLIHNRLPGESLLLMALDMAVVFVLYRENQPLTRLLKKVFLIVIHWGLTTGIQAIAIAVTLRLSGEPFLQTDDLLADPDAMIKTFSMYLLFHFLFVIVLERFRKVEPVPLSNAMWLKLISTPVISWLFVYRYFPYNQKNVDSDTLSILTGFSILIIVLNLYIFHVYRSAAKATLIQSRYLDLQSFCEKQKEYFRSLIDRENRIRNIIHDVRHNQELLARMLMEEKTGDAYRYLQKWAADIERQKTRKYTGNWDVDAVLTGQIVRMKKHGIGVRIIGTLPDTMPFDSMDICKLLSNALSNAYEACLRQMLTGEIVTLKIRYVNRFLCFTLSNPAPDQPESDNVFPSPKQGWNHGRGLEIMREVVERNQGEMKPCIEDGQFVLYVIMQAPFK